MRSSDRHSFRPRLIAALAALVACALAAPAPAARLTATGTTARACQAHALSPRDGVRTFSVTARHSGLLRAVLHSRGDWDLAVFDARSGRFVGASAGPAAAELAEGYVAAGQRLRVQACRRPGAAAHAQIRVSSVALPPAPASAGHEQIVRVSAPTLADRRRLARLDLDPAESGRRGAVDVVVHDAADTAKLRAAGLRYSVRVADLGALERDSRRADLRYARSTTRSSLPSTRDGYRHLADYEAELKALAYAHPGLVKLIALAHPSLEGRSVLGVEIARDVNVASGQPVMLQLGEHHAREWPSAELPMEWARELVNGYGRDERITRLVDATRTIVVPVVNPDGFNLSRELGFEYKRRNCRLQAGVVPAPGQCGALANRWLGVDLNRNYGGFWGGPGASTNAADDTYRGVGPFSEPEVQNVRELVSANQVTTVITNHTFGNLVLRPPGITAAATPRDATLLRSLGDAMAATNGYRSLPGYGLYDASGTTEDWSYDATGGLGYTFEHGSGQFHPPFGEVVGQYASIREAFFVALQSTANRARHAVVRGYARPGTVLRARKQFDTMTAPVLLNDFGAVGARRSFHDSLDTTMEVGAAGRFEWHLNPSTRPAASRAESWRVTCERPAGRVRARGKLRIARGQRKALDLCGLNFSVAVRRRAVGSALSRGLRVRARCAYSCKASLTLRLAASKARRYGLTKRRRGSVVVARGARKRAFSGRRRFTVRFTRVARRRLAGVRRLRLRTSAVARAGRERNRVRRTIVLRG